MTAPKSFAMETQARFAVLGAGPTGIGAAWRLLQQHSSGNDRGTSRGDCLPFLLLDESSVPGGRAASVTTPEGFTFDYGGHVLFLHPEYEELIALLNQVVREWHASVPVRGVWIDDCLIPTPVQRNIHRLPLRTLASCLWGLWRRKPVDADAVEPTLRQHLERQFGQALTRHVMGPLNQKMWAHSPDDLGSAWSSQRSGSKEKNIPDVTVRGVLRNLLLNRDQPGWTPTTTVRYPQQGGCGAIWDHIFASLPDQYRRLNSRVRGIHSEEKRLCLADGSTVKYDRLITSIPIDVLLRLLVDRPDLKARAREFRVAKVQLFGLGLRGAMPDILKGVHAINVPSPQIPFWRVNLPSNFSPGNVSDPANTWSILCECSIAPDSDVRYSLPQIEAALRKMKWIPSETKVVSVFSTSLEHGYPVPFAGRDRLLNEVQPQLEQIDIFSRGRFGGWRYEVSNQDHAFMQGVEIVDRLRDGKPEYTYRKTW